MDGRRVEWVGADTFRGFRIIGTLRDAASDGLPLFQRTGPGVGQAPGGISRPAITR